MSHRTSTLVVFGDSLSDNGNLFDLIGFPQPPAWEGRSSNGPVYAEQLASFLHMRLDDRAFAGAEASDLSPPLIVNPVTGQPLPINLSTQIAGYLADLNGHQAPEGTTALINIGSNDYDAFLQSSLPKTSEDLRRQRCREHRSGDHHANQRRRRAHHPVHAARLRDHAERASRGATSGGVRP